MGSLKNNEALPAVVTERSLKQEILQLEMKLEDQIRVRNDMERALGYRTVAADGSSENAVHKPATGLINEIAVLEMEVLYLEHHLLSLYRKVFHQYSGKMDDIKSTFKPRTQRQLDFSAKNLLLSEESIKGEASLDNGIYRCQSALSHRSMAKASDSLERAIRACNSQRISMKEGDRSFTETANRISEDMIKCMSVLYCKIAESRGVSSPASSSSSEENEPCSFSENLERMKDFNSFVEVNCLQKEILKLREVQNQNLLHSFRYLTSKLEGINPGKLHHEEKLAFWINVHNAMIMHAYLTHGIPHTNLKRLFLLSKAAYNIGGRRISADTIQNSILRCRSYLPAQWVRYLIPSKSRLKKGESYGLEREEPLLRFALTSGCHSDPPVRVYTAKGVVEEMERAKEDYVRTTMRVLKEHTILLPKLVDLHAKESGLSQNDVVEMAMRISPLKRLPQSGEAKEIEWIPHNIAFRYVIFKDIKFSIF